jgi:hypothetical protein
MPRVGLEPTITELDRAKTVHNLDLAVTVIGFNGPSGSIKCRKIPCELDSSQLPKSDCTPCTQSVKLPSVRVGNSEYCAPRATSEFKRQLSRNELLRQLQQALPQPRAPSLSESPPFICSASCVSRLLYYYLIVFLVFSWSGSPLTFVRLVYWRSCCSYYTTLLRHAADVLPHWAST